jgi:hypothetical protein
VRIGEQVAPMARCLVVFCLCAFPALAESTQVAVFYSLSTGRVRWILSADNDAALLRTGPGPGEDKLILDKAQGWDLPTLQARVSDATGKLPADDRFAIVNAVGQVVGAVIADPDGTGDRAPSGHRLLRHAEAGRGWICIGDVCVPPLPDEPVLPPGGIN